MVHNDLVEVCFKVTCFLYISADWFIHSHIIFFAGVFLMIRNYSTIGSWVFIFSILISVMFVSDFDKVYNFVKDVSE